uniref:DUF4939 domain-containing protein n=1 Tax=Fundulus heteroclitus TaxID=8078 RepID=A0A3Q2PBR9_FUNHE
MDYLTEVCQELLKRIAPVDHSPPTTAPTIPEQTESTSPHFRLASSPTPEPYSGEIGKCGGFLLQCSLVFGRSPHSFLNDRDKVSFIVGLLKGRALQWAEARFGGDLQLQISFDTFISEFKQTFGYTESNFNLEG